MNYLLHFLWLLVVSFYAFYVGMHFTLYLLRKKFLNFYFETVKTMPPITKKFKCDYLFGLCRSARQIKVITPEEEKNLYYFGYYSFNDMGECYNDLLIKIEPLIKEAGWNK